MPIYWTDVYRNHFQEHLGKPFDIQVYYGPDGAALKLATYDLARQNFRVYASMGLADRLALEEEGAFGEVVLYADVPDKEVPTLFVNALFFILANGIPLDSRFAVSFAAMDRRFAGRYDKSAFYFTTAFSPDGAFDHVTRDARVYQAFFIAPEEDEFLEEHGSDAFEEKFWASLPEDFKRGDPMRPPVDMTQMKVFHEQVKDVWLRAGPLFSVRRRSCV